MNMSSEYMNTLSNVLAASTLLPIDCCTHQSQSLSDTEVLSFVSLAGPPVGKLSPFIF